MITIHTDRHRLRNSQTELYGGQLVMPFECPRRVEIILDRVRESGLGEVRDPGEFGLEPVLRVHDADFVTFLEQAWDEWVKTGAKGEGIPIGFPTRRMRPVRPRHIEGLMGYYCLSPETTISPGTYAAALAAKDVALTGAALLAEGERAVFALCRPPGHHAARDLYGGYCFLNNAAIAAQWLRDHGAVRIAILDIDFHHGNGTQDIFYDRADVLFLSLHGDPIDNYPYFLGHADETGAGPGTGFNVNYALPNGTAWDSWGAALEDALGRIRDYAPDALVVSFGADTFEHDPISFFKLKSEDYTRTGARIATLGLPTLFVMEGGYAVEALGVNTVNLLTGFESA